MTKAQYERQQLKQVREEQLRLLAEAQRDADPRYVLHATGYALEHWHGSRRDNHGRKRTSIVCPTNSPSSMSTRPAANSGFSPSI